MKRKRFSEEQITCSDQYGLCAFCHERRDAIGDPPIHEGTRHAPILHYEKQVQGPDAYPRPSNGEIKEARRIDHKPL